MLFTESNVGDEGANEKQNLIMKFIEGDREAQNITNTKVNLQNPVAKQRGAKYIILDVTNLKLDDNQKREFLAALAKFYESNFWIKFKSVGLMTWLSLVLAKTLQAYMKFGNLEDPMSHWKQ